jgi:hypothetical protein
MGSVSFNTIMGVENNQEIPLSLCYLILIRHYTIMEESAEVLNVGGGSGAPMTDDEHGGGGEEETEKAIIEYCMSWKSNGVVL